MTDTDLWSGAISDYYFDYEWCYYDLTAAASSPTVHRWGWGLTSIILFRGLTNMYDKSMRFSVTFDWLGRYWRFGPACGRQLFPLVLPPLWWRCYWCALAVLYCWCHYKSLNRAGDLLHLMLFAFLIANILFPSHNFFPHYFFIGNSCWQCKLL